MRCPIRTAVWALAALGVAACTLTTSLDGYSGGGGSDASTVSDATASDAADGGDAPVARDGGSDADAARPFCASLSPKPTYCNDFDDGLLTGFFDGVRKSAGVVALDDAAASAPNAVVASLPANAGACLYADLKKAETRTFASVRMAFALRNGALDGGAIGSQFQRIMHFDPCDLTLEANASGATLRTNSGDFSFGRPVTAGEWKRVEIRLTSAPIGGAILEATVDGLVAIASRTLAQCDVAAATGYFFSVGLYCSPTGDPRELRFDDVVLDLK